MKSNKNKKWTVRNGAAELIEKLGIESHAQKMIIVDVLEGVAEHYVFEGKKLKEYEQI